MHGKLRGKKAGRPPVFLIQLCLMVMLLHGYSTVSKAGNNIGTVQSLFRFYQLCRDSFVYVCVGLSSPYHSQGCYFTKRLPCVNIISSLLFS